MKLCPRSARALGQQLTDDQATEWCGRMFSHTLCQDCEEGCRPNWPTLSELMPQRKSTKKNNDNSEDKHEQLRLF